MYIDRLKIENLKSFAKAQVDLNHPERKYDSAAQTPRLKNVNLFLGENGAGKTTVCQALCVAVLKNILATSAAGFRTNGFVRIGEKDADITATIRLFAQDGTVGKTEAHATIKQRHGTEFVEGRGQPAKWAEVLYEEESPAFFLAAYGVSRRTERPEAYNERLRNRRYQRIASLFESHIGLIPLSLAFEYSRQRIDEVLGLVNRLLPKRVQLTLQRDPGHELLFAEPLFDADGVVLAQSGLSDGYRLHVAWIVDFISHLARVMPSNIKLEDAEGVVIVDEIDLLLHAEWQRYVVPNLAETFPKIQFLITSHSPIVAGTLQSQNLFLIEHVGAHTSEIHDCDENVYGLSIDKILVRLFGLESPRAPELELQLVELEKRAQNGDRDASIEYLRRLRLGVQTG